MVGEKPSFPAGDEQTEIFVVLDNGHYLRFLAAITGELAGQHAGLQDGAAGEQVETPCVETLHQVEADPSPRIPELENDTVIVPSIERVLVTEQQWISERMLMYITA